MAYLRVLSLLHAVVQLRRALAHFVSEQEAKASHQRVGSLIHWRRGAKLLTYFPWWRDGGRMRVGVKWSTDLETPLRRTQWTGVRSSFLVRCMSASCGMTTTLQQKKYKKVIWQRVEGLYISHLYKQVALLGTVCAWEWCGCQVAAWHTHSLKLFNFLHIELTWIHRDRDSENNKFLYFCYIYSTTWKERERDHEGQHTCSEPCHSTSTKKSLLHKKSTPPDLTVSKAVVWVCRSLCLSLGVCEIMVDTHPTPMKPRPQQSLTPLYTDLIL